jgi:hypothetical protein
MFVLHFISQPQYCRIHSANAISEMAADFIVSRRKESQPRVYQRSFKQKKRFNRIIYEVCSLQT